MDRATAIRQSLTGFVCGIASWIPVVGFFPGLYALIVFSRVQRRYANQWNPASAYLKAGAILGVLGFIVSVIIGILVGFSIVNDTAGY